MSYRKQQKTHSRLKPSVSITSELVNIPSLLQEAVTLHQAGQIDDAESLYHRVLELDSQHADALHLSGIVLRQRGDLQAAVDLIRKAITCNPDEALYHSNLGSICIDCGQWADAQQCYQRSLQLNPGDSEAQNNLGFALANLEKFEQAESCFREAIRLSPEYEDAYFHLGLALGKLERPEKAEQSFLAALKLRPKWPEAWYNLGDTQKHQKRYGDAEKSYRQAFRLQPANIKACVNLGDALKEQEKFIQAMECYEQALELDPECAEAFNNMGMVFYAQNKVEQAVQCYEKAHLIKPDYAEVYLNRGNAVLAKGQINEAMDCFQKALELDPGYSFAHWNYSFTLLLSGDYKRGWQEHEWRFKNGISLARHTGIPLWQGEKLDGRTLMVYAEQGIGDEIRFANCIPDVIKQARHVVIECDPRLQTLYQRSFPEASVFGVKRDELDWLSTAPPIDLQIAVGSLPMYTRTRLEDFPGEGSYLHADPERVAYWKDRLQTLGPGPRVGVAWRGGLITALRELNYAGFKKDWQVILQIPGVQFINMMYDECSEELEWAKKEWGVEIHHFSELDQFNDMEGAAALLSALDLLITVPIAVSEMAGGLAVPTWYLILTNHINTLGTDYLPWFPHTRCVFKNCIKEWGPVTEKLAQELLVFSREF